MEKDYVRNLSGQPSNFWETYQFRLKGAQLAVFYRLIVDSEWNPSEDHYYLEKKKIKKAALARDLGFSRNSITAALDSLLEKGFIKEWTNYQGKEYYTITIPKYSQGVKIKVIEFLLSKFEGDPEVITFLAMAAYMYRTKMEPTSTKGLAIAMGLNGEQQYNINKIIKYLSLLSWYNLLEYEKIECEINRIKYYKIRFKRVSSIELPKQELLEDPRTPEQIFEEDFKGIKI